VDGKTKMLERCEAWFLLEAINQVPGEGKIDLPTPSEMARDCERANHDRCD
jgi:hypothetical protein